MKVYKKRLPEGVRSTFAYDRGVKVKILNTLYYNTSKKKKNNTNNKKDSESDK